MRQILRDIDSFENDWKSFYKFISHGLAIFHQTSMTCIVEEFLIISPIEILSVSFRAGDIHKLIILIYRTPGSIGTITVDLIKEFQLIISGIG